MTQPELQFISGQGRFVIVETWTKPQPKTVLPRFRVQIGQRGRDYAFKIAINLNLWGMVTPFYNRRCLTPRHACRRAFVHMKRALVKNSDNVKRDVKALRAWFEKEVL